MRDPNKASPLSGTSFGALENARSGTSISDTGSERAIRMPKRRSQVHLNNYSGGVAKQFGGRNAGLSQSPFPDGFRQMHDYTGTQGGDDFLSRLERAEQRDSQSFAARAAPTPHELALSNPYKQAAEYQQVRQKHSGSSIVIGGDAPPTGYNRGELYQTTNSAKQHELSAQLQVAHEREFTKQLMQQHGFTQQELDRGGEAAKAWVRQQLEASRRTAPASKMATGGRRPQSAAAVAASPMRFQRSGAPMLRQH